MTGSLYTDRDIENLQAIVKFCEDIEGITERHGCDEADLKENISLQYSCAFALMQIGEYVKRLSSDLKDKWPDIEWKKIIKMRDFVAHNYAGVDIIRLRSVILNKIPDLKEKCRSILSGL